MRNLFSLGAIGLFGLLLGTCSSAGKTQLRLDAQELVDQSTATFDRLRGNYEELADRIKVAKAIAIFPEIARGGFILGFGGGKGLMIARNDQGEWGQPAFYQLGDISLGASVGIEATEAVILFMTDRAVDEAVNGKISYGAAAGPGASARAGTGTEDVYSWAQTVGLSVSLSLDSVGLRAMEDWNGAYYDDDLTVVDIIVRGMGQSTGTETLRTSLEGKASKKQEEQDQKKEGEPQVRTP